MTVKQFFYLPVILFLLIGSLQSEASPIQAKIDQRQEGETNVRADLSNIVIVVVPSDGVKLVDTDSLGTLLQLFASKRRTAAGKTPPPPSSPYKVDIEQAAIDRLHADMDSINSIIPALKTIEDKEDEMPAIKDSETAVPSEMGSMGNNEKKGDDKQPEDGNTSVKPIMEVAEVVKTEENVNNDGTKMTATTMEAIITSANSYSKNGGSDNKEKLVNLQPASVTVLLAKRPETPSDATASSVSTEHKSEPTTFVEIHKQSSSIPLRDMPSPVSLTIEDLKRPIHIPSEDMATKSAASPVKVAPKVSSNQDTKTRHHHNQQPTKPLLTKKPVATPSEPTEQSTASSPKNSAKSSKPEVNQQEHERKLKMLQTGLIHCLPGEKLNDDGECVSGQIRQSRREDMERLLAALRFGVGPAYRI